MPHVRQILEMQELMFDSEPLNIYRQWNVWNPGLKFEPQRKVGIQQKRKRCLQIFFQRVKKVEEIKIRMNHRTLALGLSHRFGVLASIRGSFNDTPFICFDSAEMPSEKHLVCFCVTLQPLDVEVHTQFSFVQELSTVLPGGFGIFARKQWRACVFIPCSYMIFFFFSFTDHDVITQCLCVAFFLCTFRDAETFLLGSKKIQASNSGWLVFDITATSNHWVMNPQQNLGLQLCVETVDGKFAHFIILQINVRLLELTEGHKVTQRQSKNIHVWLMFSVDFWISKKKGP